MIQITKKMPMFSAARLLCAIPSTHKQHITHIFIDHNGLAVSTDGCAAVMCDLSDLTPAPGWYKVIKSTTQEVLLMPDGDQDITAMYDDGVWAWFERLTPADAHQATATWRGDTHDQTTSAALYHLAQEKIIINIKYIDLIYKHITCPETSFVDWTNPVIFRGPGVVAVVMPMKI